MSYTQVMTPRNHTELCLSTGGGDDSDFLCDCPEKSYNMPKCESCGFGNEYNLVRRYEIVNMPVTEIDWNGQHDLCDNCMTSAKANFPELVGDAYIAIIKD